MPSFSIKNKTAAQHNTTQNKELKKERKKVLTLWQRKTYGISVKATK